MQPERMRKGVGSCTGSLPHAPHLVPSQKVRVCGCGVVVDGVWRCLSWLSQPVAGKCTSCLSHSSVLVWGKSRAHSRVVCAVVARTSVPPVGRAGGGAGWQPPRRPAAPAPRRAPPACRGGARTQARARPLPATLSLSVSVNATALGHAQAGRSCGSVDASVIVDAGGRCWWPTARGRKPVGARCVWSRTRGRAPGSLAAEAAGRYGCAQRKSGARARAPASPDVAVEGPVWCGGWCYAVAAVGDTGAPQNL